MNIELGEVQAAFADIIWTNEPVGSGELVKICERELKKVSVLAEASDVKLEKIINIRYERQNLPLVLLKIFKATGELVYYSVGKKVVNKPVDGFYLLYYMHLEVESDYGLS